MTDLISRADAIEAVKDTILKRFNLADWYEEILNCGVEIDDRINALPSAEAVQGEWVRNVKEYNDCDGRRVVYWYECDQCGARPPKDQRKNEWHSNYCPSCGARMKGGDSE